MASKTSKQPTTKTAAEPFTIEDVKKLVALVEKTDVSLVAWSRGVEKVVIRRGAVVAMAPQAPAAVHHAPVAAPVPAAPVAAPAPKGDAKVAEVPGALVHSPFVGTFYRAPSPDSPVFTEVGQKVKKGQVLCIVEAMKLMNELECEVDGVVAEIYVQNATPVEFNEKLFRIIPG
jgi:acetyl-CoA carboxylase biotin carboxyl carrier protein